ncbi:metal-sensing transcriptional repressor [Robbsia sp. KACC 23696]|uniref:metal-sensing transcriptional repressor n=1 Tax=Robbsia sp. KACC 23696 TaxID=3149231 RepID=UPI00325A90DF
MRVNARQCASGRGHYRPKGLRAEGHLRSITAMLEAGRPCVDIAQQLFAVEKAVCQAKRILIQDHIDHCLEDSVQAIASGQRDALETFKQITKYL